MTGKRRSDATLFREILDLQPSRGISGVQLDGTLRLMRRFPERGVSTTQSLTGMRISLPY